MLPCAAHQVSVPVNSSFIQYLQNYPLILDVFGHYQQHPLHKASTEIDPNRYVCLSVCLSDSLSVYVSVSPLTISRNL